MENYHHTLVHSCSDEMVPYIDVFGPSVFTRVLAKCNCTLIITEDSEALRTENILLFNNLIYVPDSLQLKLDILNHVTI
jgi:hypothetical protein